MLPEARVEETALPSETEQAIFKLLVRAVMKRGTFFGRQGGDKLSKGRILRSLTLQPEVDVLLGYNRPRINDHGHAPGRSRSISLRVHRKLVIAQGFTGIGYRFR